MKLLALVLLAACSDSAMVEEPPEPRCGDQVVDAGEGCDDGNAINGDGCDRDCQHETLARANWTFFPMLGGPAGPCRANVTNVEVYAETGGMGVFPCAAGTGEVFVPRHLVRVFARAVDATGATVVESTPEFTTVQFRIDLAFYEDAGFIRALTEKMTCDQGNAVATSMPRFPAPSRGYDFAFYDDGGYVRAFVDACLAAVRYTDASNVTITRQFVCSDDLDSQNGVLYSPPLRAGTYDVAFEPQGKIAVVKRVVVGTNTALADVDFTVP